MLATSKEGNEAKKETRSDYEITLEGEVKNMVEEKIRRTEFSAYRCNVFALLYLRKFHITKVRGIVIPRFL